MLVFMSITFTNQITISMGIIFTYVLRVLYFFSKSAILYDFVNPVDNLSSILTTL